MTTSPLWNALAIGGTRKAARSAATVMMCLMVTPSLRSVFRKSGATDHSGLDAELVRLLAEAGDVAQLDVLVTAHDVGQPRQAHRPLVARRREVAQRAVDEGAVLARQRALHTTHRGAAEGIEGGAAQALHPGERAEGAVEPSPELQLALEAERAEQRWVQVVLDLHAARILLGERAA